MTGNDYLTEDDILASAEIIYGTNLFQLDVRQITHSLAGLSVVEEVKVRRRWPASLVVTIVERIPVAYVAGDHGFWTVDGRGTVLYFVDSLTKPLPLITASPRLNVNAGVRLDEPYFLSALRFSEALTLQSVNRLSEIHVSPSEMTAFTRDHVTINVGISGDMREKSRVLESLLTNALQRGIDLTYVDVRHPRNPIVERKR